MLEETSRALPAMVLHPVTAVLFLLLVRAMMKTPHASGRLLLFIVWLRYVMQAYHELTYVSIGGISINAMASLGVCAAGGLLLWKQLQEVARFPLILCLIGVVAVSGLMNGAAEPMVETILKWGYFFVVTLAVMDCIRRDGDIRIFGLLLWAFVPPLVYQALSIVLGVSRAAESDGSVSYIGGYNHEAAFSIVLVTCFAVASLAPRLNPAVRLGVLTACLAGILAANYRTSFIAIAPIAFGYFVFGAARAFSPGRRMVVSLIGLLVVAGGLIAANVVLSERMSDFTQIADQTGDLIRPPEEFTTAEQKLLSGRLYLWNRYLEEYRGGTDAQWLFGHGPDAWVDRFHLYAHNTVISYLYEFGLAGALLIVSIWLAMLWRALQIKDWALRGQLFCVHLGFVLLNMATMPFWQIEGLIFYGLLCGYTVCLTPGRARGPMLVPQMSPEGAGGMPEWWAGHASKVPGLPGASPAPQKAMTRRVRV
jgi:hypothetical protein